MISNDLCDAIKKILDKISCHGHFKSTKNLIFNVLDNSQSIPSCKLLGLLTGGTKVFLNLTDPSFKLKC